MSTMPGRESAPGKIPDFFEVMRERRPPDTILIAIGFFFTEQGTQRYMPPALLEVYRTAKVGTSPDKVYEWLRELPTPLQAPVSELLVRRGYSIKDIQGVGRTILSGYNSLGTPQVTDAPRRQVYGALSQGARTGVSDETREWLRKNSWGAMPDAHRIFCHRCAEMETGLTPDENLQLAVDYIRASPVGRMVGQFERTPQEFLALAEAVQNARKTSRALLLPRPDVQLNLRAIHDCLGRVRVEQVGDPLADAAMWSLFVEKIFQQWEQLPAYPGEPGTAEFRLFQEDALRSVRDEQTGAVHEEIKGKRYVLVLPGRADELPPVLRETLLGTRTDLAGLSFTEVEGQNNTLEIPTNRVPWLRITEDGQWLLFWKGGHLRDPHVSPWADPQNIVDGACLAVDANGRLRVVENPPGPDPFRLMAPVFQLRGS